MIAEQVPDSLIKKPSIDPFVVASQVSGAGINSDSFRLNEATRQTTESEKIIGELRQWFSLGEDWDGLC